MREFFKYSYSIAQKIDPSLNKWDSSWLIADCFMNCHIANKEFKASNCRAFSARSFYFIKKPNNIFRFLRASIIISRNFTHAIDENKLVSIGEKKNVFVFENTLNWEYHWKYLKFKHVQKYCISPNGQILIQNKWRNFGV